MEDIVKQIHHTGITVRNLEESIAFYKKVFGFEHVGGCDLTVEAEGEMKGVQIRIAFLRAGEDSVELLEYLKPKTVDTVKQVPWRPGSQHVSFKVSDIWGIYERNRDEVNFMSAPIDYKSEEIDTTWVYLWDPNGTILELSEDHMERQFTTG